MSGGVGEERGGRRGEGECLRRQVSSGREDERGREGGGEREGGGVLGKMRRRERGKRGKGKKRRGEGECL